MMGVQELAASVAEATKVPHHGQELGPGISQIAPVGFQPGDASYFIRIEHSALRNAVTVGAGPFSGHLLGVVVDRLQQEPEIAMELAADATELGWELRKTPASGSSVFFEAREGNSIVGELDAVRQLRIADVLIRLSTFMLGSLAITLVPSNTRTAKPRDEATAQNVSWEYDPAERDRSTATHRRLENWLIDRLEREGLRALDPVGQVEFDLAWLERDGSLSLCEVKSTSGHEDKQIRLGLGQVLHYAARLRDEWPREINHVLFVETGPSDPVWVPLAAQHGVVIAWPESWDETRAALSQPSTDTELAG